MKTNKSRNLSFFYLSETHIEVYREYVLDFLENNHEDFERVGFPEVIVEFYNFQIRKDNRLDGHVYIQDLEDKINKFEEVCNYILSKKRNFIPVCVSCKNKKDYGMIEKILKENYGEKGKLTNGFLGIPGLFNQKNIKFK